MDFWWILDAKLRAKLIKDSIILLLVCKLAEVAKMLKSILNIKELPKNLDSTDGLAAAVCHYFNFNSDNEKKKYSNWSSFINKNPDKIA